MLSPHATGCVLAVLPAETGQNSDHPTGRCTKRTRYWDEFMTVFSFSRALGEHRPGAGRLCRISLRLFHNTRCGYLYEQIPFELLLNLKCRSGRSGFSAESACRLVQSAGSPRLTTRSCDGAAHRLRTHPGLLKARSGGRPGRRFEGLREERPGLDVRPLPEQFSPAPACAVPCIPRLWGPIQDPSRRVTARSLVPRCHSARGQTNAADPCSTILVRRSEQCAASMS